jgi:aquaporin Z
MRRILMGVAMGVTAVLIIHSPMGKRSGAHFNPAITLTYFRLHKIDKWDAAFYVVFQFIGGVAGVGFAAILLGSSIAAPEVNYAVTVPGPQGTTAAFFAEFFMATVLMAVVLWSSNTPPLAKYTSYFVGVLIALYILVCSAWPRFTFTGMDTKKSPAQSRFTSTQPECPILAGVNFCSCGLPRK